MHRKRFSTPTERVRRFREFARSIDADPWWISDEELHRQLVRLQLEDIQKCWRSAINTLQKTSAAFAALSCSFAELAPRIAAAFGPPTFED